MVSPVSHGPCMLTDSDLRTPLSEGRVNTPKASLDQYLGATGWCVVPPLWEGDQHRFLQHLVQRKHCPLGLGACGCVLLFGFCVLGFGCVLVSPPPTCSVSILLMMTWALRPHGVRTRGKKTLQSVSLLQPFAPVTPTIFDHALEPVTEVGKDDSSLPRQESHL